MTVTETQGNAFAKDLPQRRSRSITSEKQRGASLVACIGCTRGQEKLTREILHEEGEAIRLFDDETSI